MSRAPADVTALLQEWCAGDDAALGRMLPLVDRKAKVVELRFFGGLDVPEMAAVLDVSENTIIRDWAFAKAWLRRELESGP